MVLDRRSRMNSAIKLLSRIFEILKILKNNIIFKKFQSFFLNFQNPGYMWKNPIKYICVEKFKSVSWKMTKLWHFWFRKWLFFTLFPGISSFSRFSIFVRFGPFKKCFRVVFRVLDEKLTQKHVPSVPNIKFLISSFLDLDLEWPWPWMYSPKP